MLNQHGITIAPSAYYEARIRKPSRRAVRDGEVVELIRAAREQRFVRTHEPVDDLTPVEVETAHYAARNRLVPTG